MVETQMFTRQDITGASIRAEEIRLMCHEYCESRGMCFRSMKKCPHRDLQGQREITECDSYVRNQQV